MCARIFNITPLLHPVSRCKKTKTKHQKNHKKKSSQDEAPAGCCLMPVLYTNNARLCPRCARCSSVPHTSHQTINNALKPPPLTHKIQNTQGAVGFESISKTAAANISYAVAALHRSCQTCQFRKENQEAKTRGTHEIQNQQAAVRFQPLSKTTRALISDVVVALPPNCHRNNDTKKCKKNITRSSFFRLPFDCKPSPRQQAPLFPNEIFLCSPLVTNTSIRAMHAMQNEKETMKIAYELQNPQAAVRFQHFSYTACAPISNIILALCAMRHNYKARRMKRCF